MPEVQSGIAFHCHHDRLYEFVSDYAGRIRFIKREKPDNEVALRLRLFQIIPPECLPGENSPQLIAYAAAWAVLDKASLAYARAMIACDTAWAVLDKARLACDKARAAYEDAAVAYDRIYGREIEALHTNLCPDCPWDGKTIFPQK